MCRCVGGYGVVWVCESECGVMYGRDVRVMVVVAMVVVVVMMVVIAMLMLLVAVVMTLVAVAMVIVVVVMVQELWW